MTKLNTLTAADLKRRGMVAIEDGLRHGPLHLVKRNKPAAVVLTEAEYQRLSAGESTKPLAGMTAMQWLLASKPTAKRSKRQIDADIKAGRDW
jgi:PHD/YefM family antitoxin component YafN of YafNO toxin-antitoxin module